MVEVMHLRVRYFQDSTPEDTPCREESFIRRDLEMALPLAETALILVDVWNNHFNESWLERARKVTTDAIVPALHAARAAGLTVVHAPSPEAIRASPHLRRFVSEGKKHTPSWPPDDFRKRKGIYEAFRGPRSQPPGIRPIPGLGVSPAIELKKDEPVIARQAQLQNFLEERGILHLIYAGFATNWCILHRDYGTRAMAGLGYNVIILRDATAGVEYPDTLDTGLATELAVREIEQQLGFSASNEDFLAGCGAARTG